MDVKLEDTIDGTFGTATFATGAATNADSTPTCVVLEQGTALGYAPTCTNKATGLYNVQIVCSAANGFEVGKQYSAYVVVVMGGVTARGPVMGLGAFTIRARSPDDLTYPATTGRSTLVAADGSVSPNWADVKSPTTTVNLSGTSLAGGSSAPTVEEIDAELTANHGAGAWRGRGGGFVP